MTPVLNLSGVSCFDLSCPLYTSFPGEILSLSGEILSLPCKILSLSGEILGLGENADLFIDNLDLVNVVSSIEAKSPSRDLLIGGGGVGSLFSSSALTSL